MSKGRQEFIEPNLLTPRLSLVAAPLGNVFDLSLRSIECLKKADLILCEDTRKIIFWFKELSLDLENKKLVSIPGDSERSFDFSKLLAFKNWVFMSDAGTPVVSDPGNSLLEWAKLHQFRIEALPGPSAPTLLWQWSGGFGLPFVFAGFVPKTKSESDLEEFFSWSLQNEGSFCFFDTKYQILETLKFLKSHLVLAKRRIFLGRDMTKSHEQLIEGCAADLWDFVSGRIEKNEGLGEMSLLLESHQQSEERSQSMVSLSSLIEIRSSAPKNAAKLMSQICRATVKDCYEAIVKIKKI